jgi:outer membrane protein OmpA-like peptidoglycan-associated protein
MIDDSTGRTTYLRLYVGGYGALGINYHSAAFGALPGTVSCCGELQNQTALAPAVAAFIEVPIIKDLRLHTRVGYTTLGATLTTSESIGNEPVLDDGTVPTPVRQDVLVEYSLDAALPMISIEPTVGYQFVDRFWGSIGVRAGYLIGPTYVQKETLQQPEGYTFLDGSAVRNQSSGAIPEANSLQFHAVVGLSYELFTRSTFSLSPEVRYFLPLTAISSVDWRVQSLQIGVMFRHGIYTPKEPTIIRDTVVVRDTVIVEKPNLRNEGTYLSETTFSDLTRDDGDMRLITTTKTETYVKEVRKAFQPLLQLAFSTVQDGNRVPLDSIRIEERDVIESYPLLPQVFFQTGSSALDSTSQILLDEDGVKDFRVMDLQRDQIDVYRNLLNVIGYRLSKDPAAKMRIDGHTDNVDIEKNDRVLGRRRAEAVRDYLVNMWKIDPSRLTVEGHTLPDKPANQNTEDGKGENRRVEFNVTDLSILEPVEFRQRDLVVSPTSVSIRPTVQNGQDISSWNIDVVQGASKLTSFSGTGRPEPVQWESADPNARPRTDKPVVAKLTVANELGQTFTSDAAVEVDYVTLQLMKSSTEGGKLIEKYSLIVFDYNSATLNASNQRLMDRVRDRIQPESKVKILGFADRQGKPEYNRELARRRCVEAQRVLGLPDSQVTIEPIGSDTLLFNNDLPEGRSYSRTVQIVIETPVR